MLDGKIQQSYINIQFSILYTNKNGDRVFKIITYSQKLSNSKYDILNSINYGNVNLSYLWAVIYNVKYILY